MKGGAKESGGLRYAATFNEKILGVGCDVDVAVDLVSGEALVIASMRRTLSSEPAFRISREDLASLSSCVKTAKERAGILDNKVKGSSDHQLNCACGGATLIVSKPAGKPARFALNVGLFHREGGLEELSAKELDEAVAKLDALTARVASKM